MPRVSIIVPAHNAEPYLAETLASLLRQTCQPLEIVVVDDGSTDATAEVAERFGAGVRVIRQAHAGPGAARNTGVAHARGDTIAFVDADDAIAPERTAVLMAVLEQAPSRAGFATSDMWLWDGTRLVEPFRIAPPPGGEKDLNALLECNRPYAGVVIRRRVFEDVGGFRPDLWSHEDSDLWLRVLGTGRTFVHVAEPLYLYRQREGSLSRCRVRQAADACRVYEEALRTLPLTWDQRRRLRYHLWRERARLQAALAQEAGQEGGTVAWGLRRAAGAGWHLARFALRPHHAMSQAWRRRGLRCWPEPAGEPLGSQAAQRK